MKLFTCLSLFAIALSLAPVSQLLANPSTKNPETLLKIRPGEKVDGDYLAADYEAISQRYAKAKAIADELSGKLKDDKLALGDGRQVGPFSLLNSALNRDAEFLKLRGEACGWDLAARIADYNRLLDNVARKLLTLPGMNTKPLQLQLEKSHAAGLKRLPQIEILIARQKFVQAEGELNEILDDLRRTAVWFPTGDHQTMFKPFLKDLPQCKELRRDQAIADLQSIIDRAPTITDVQTELTQAATQIGATGQAMWNGQMLSGPAFLTAWQTNWPKLQAGSKRALMARRTIEQIRPGENKYQELVTAHEQFAKSLPALLATIIQNDAQRVQPAEAATLYPQYVAAAAGLCAMGPRQELENAFAPALTALATKAGIEKDVAAHRTAMEPLLAWKRFFARSQAKALAAKATPVHDWLTKSCGSPGNPHTILPQQQPHISRAQVVNSVDQVLPAVIPAGPPPSIVITDVVPVSAAGQRWVARYQQRVFTLVGAPNAAAWKTAADELEQQLLATPQQPPLSLDAATALATARLGVFETAGGPVVQVTVEPLLTRFVTLPDEAGSLLPLGALAPESFDPSTPGQQGSFLSLRCDLRQPWLQNECFVILP